MNNEIGLSTDMFPDVSGRSTWVENTLRSALRTLRDETDDDAFRAVLDDVIVGQRPLRDLIRQPAFETLASSGIDSYQRTLAEMTYSQRRALMEDATRIGLEAGVLEPGETVPVSKA
ncbi:MAG: hypothetical protein FWD63_06135 [Propionibacteriaceae bacterium]|nr:hypothetical protein [Propionibacteriaceae bacterium]